MNKNIIAGLAIAGALTLGGCSTGTVAPTESSSPAQTNAPGFNPETTAPEPEETPEANVSGLRFGNPATYEDGISITVSPKGSFTNYEGVKAYKFEVTIENGTDKPFDPALAMGSVVYGDNGDVADTTFDSDGGTDFGFTGQILPGKKQTIVEAYIIPEDSLDDVVVTYSPSFDHDDASWVGSVGK